MGRRGWVKNRQNRFHVINEWPFGAKLGGSSRRGSKIWGSLISASALLKLVELEAIHQLRKGLEGSLILFGGRRAKVNWWVFLIRQIHLFTQTLGVKVVLRYQRWTHWYRKYADVFSYPTGKYERRPTSIDVTEIWKFPPIFQFFRILVGFEGSACCRSAELWAVIKWDKDEYLTEMWHAAPVASASWAGEIFHAAWDSKTLIWCLRYTWGESMWDDNRRERPRIYLILEENFVAVQGYLGQRGEVGYFYWN